MSILNVHIAPSGGSALVGVDTEAVAPSDGSPCAQASKMAVMSCPLAVIAARGVLGFLPLVFMGAVARALDFDGTLEAMPEILVGAVDTMIELQRLGAMTGDAPIDALSVVLVGWSESKRRMLGRFFEQHDRVAGFVSTDISSWYIAPCDDVLAKLPAPSSRDAMATLAHAQVRRLEEICPASSGGGQLILETVTQHGVNVETVCKLTRLRRGVNTAARDLAAQSVQTIFSGAAVVVGRNSEAQSGTMPIAARLRRL